MGQISLVSLVQSLVLASTIAVSGTLAGCSSKEDDAKQSSSTQAERHYDNPSSAWATYTPTPHTSPTPQQNSQQPTIQSTPPLPQQDILIDQAIINPTYVLNPPRFSPTPSPPQQNGALVDPIGMIGQPRIAPVEPHTPTIPTPTPTPTIETLPIPPIPIPVPTLEPLQPVILTPDYYLGSDDIKFNGTTIQLPDDMYVWKDGTMILLKEDMFTTRSFKRFNTNETIPLNGNVLDLGPFADNPITGSFFTDTELWAVLDTHDTTYIRQEEDTTKVYFAFEKKEGKLLPIVGPIPLVTIIPIVEEPLPPVIPQPTPPVPQPSSPAQTLESLVLNEDTVRIVNNGLLISNVSRLNVTDISTNGNVFGTLERRNAKFRLLGTYNSHSNDVALIGLENVLEEDSVFFERVNTLPDGIYSLSIKYSPDNVPTEIGQWPWIDNKTSRINKRVEDWRLVIEVKDHTITYVNGDTFTVVTEDVMKKTTTPSQPTTTPTEALRKPHALGCDYVRFVGQRIIFSDPDNIILWKDGFWRTLRELGETLEAFMSADDYRCSLKTYRVGDTLEADLTPYPNNTGYGIAWKTPSGWWVENDESCLEFMRTSTEYNSQGVQTKKEVRFVVQKDNDQLFYYLAGGIPQYDVSHLIPSDVLNGTTTTAPTNVQSSSESANTTLSQFLSSVTDLTAQAKEEEGTLEFIVTKGSPTLDPIVAETPATYDFFKNNQHDIDTIVSTTLQHEPSMSDIVLHVETIYGVMASSGDGKVYRFGSGLWKAFVELTKKDPEHWGKYIPASAEIDEGGITTHIELINSKTRERGRLYHFKNGSGTIGFGGKLFDLYNLFSEELGEPLFMDQNMIHPEKGKIGFWSGGTLELDTYEPESVTVIIPSLGLNYYRSKGNVEKESLAYEVLVVAGIMKILPKAYSTIMHLLVTQSPVEEQMIENVLQRITLSLPIIANASPQLRTVVLKLEDLVARANTPAGIRNIRKYLAIGDAFAEQLILALADGEIMRQQELNSHVFLPVWDERVQSATAYMESIPPLPGRESFRGIQYIDNDLSQFDRVQNRILINVQDKGNLGVLNHELSHALDYAEKKPFMDMYIRREISYADMEQRAMQSHIARLTGGKHGNFLKGLIFNPTLYLEHLEKHWEPRAGSILRVEKQFGNKFWYGMRR